MENIYAKLKQYARSDFYGFHMPGHKRNKNLTAADLPYDLDITEIEGFDDLHHAGGMLKEAQERAARVYGADETHFLVNGSTAGILSGIMGSTTRGGRILMSRNCHKSVYHSVFMKELDAVYLYPHYQEELQLNGEVLAGDVEMALKAHEDVQAVVIVSPTYDGVVSDIPAIAEAVHAWGIPLIVDEAHGAHFGFHEYFPDNSNRAGADIVIHSLHKTLPSLTQTALLHISGSIVNREAVRDYLQMLQSSSPSYLLMASIDACVQQLDEQPDRMFSDYIAKLINIRTQLKQLEKLELLETPRYDCSKLVVSVRGTNMTGKELYQQLLERYHLQAEMAAGTYVILMTAPGDRAEGFDRLLDALFEIDGQIEWESHVRYPGRLPQLEKVYTSAETACLSAGPGQKETVGWRDSIGRVAVERAYLYPPGIPLFVQGERINEYAVGLLETYHRLNFDIQGLKQNGKIEVLTDGQDILPDGEKFNR